MANTLSDQLFQVKLAATVELEFPLTRRPGMPAPFLVQGVKTNTCHSGASEYQALDAARDYCFRLRAECQELMGMLDAHLANIEKEIWKKP